MGRQKSRAGDGTSMPAVAWEGGEDYAWLREALEAVVALGRAIQPEPGTPGTPQDVFNAARPALRRLADFQTMGLVGVEQEGFGFHLVQSDPPESAETVWKEVEHQTREGSFAWALYQDRPVLVPGHFLGRWVLLHVLSTRSRITGMFIASLEEEAPFIPEMAQKVLSILLQSCAAVLESGALYEELARHNRDLEATIERRTWELRRSEEEARAASKAKSEFLANMSHEIRTPINGVLGSLSLLLETDMASDQREYADTATRSAQNLLGLINDILDFSKIEAGQLSLESIGFDLRQVAEETVELMASRAAERGLELQIRYAPGTPRHFQGDPGRIRQVLLNLVGNAIKFTHDGHVLLSVEPQGGEGKLLSVGLAVEDTGIGIEPEHLSRIFEKFEQADASTTRRYGGTGLGLAICRELAELMGGSIQATSRSGWGSTFSLSLPLLVSEDPGEAGEGPSVPQDASALVVAPSAVTRNTLWEELERVGVKATTATSPEGALELVRKAAERGRPFAMTFLDDSLGLGRMEEAARAIRGQFASGRMLLVGLTRGPRTGSGGLHEPGLFDRILPKPLLERRILAAVRLLAGDAGPAGAEPEDGPSLPGAGEPQPGCKVRGRVLLVEDDEINRRMAGVMLEKMGVALRMAEDGARALQILRQDTFDLILMDCQMPELDGFEATKSIRAREAGRTRIPIIALTASALQGDRDRCLAAGMDDYLSKPLTLGQLRSMVSRWLPAAEEMEASPGSTVPPILAEPAFDAETALHRVGGNVELLQEIGKIFFDGWGDLREQLKTALARDDEDVVSRLAHRIKGSALNLSAGEVAELAGQLEVLGLQLRLDEADPVLERLVAAVDGFREAFEESLSKCEVAA